MRKWPIYVRFGHFFVRKTFFSLSASFIINKQGCREPSTAFIIKTYKSRNVLGESRLVRLGLGFSFFLPKLRPWILFVNDVL